MHTLPNSSNKNAESLVTQWLKAIGEDVSRPGLLQTPRRVAKAWEFLCNGYTMDLDEVVNGAIFDEPQNGLVVVKNIRFYSLCEHHLLPFFGECHVAYLPQGRVIGLSKIPRIIEMFSHRLQLQERLTNQISQSLESILKPQGVIVTMEAQHLCTLMRGVQKQNAQTLTISRTGVFHDDPDCLRLFTNVTAKGADL